MFAIASYWFVSICSLPASDGPPETCIAVVKVMMFPNQIMNLIAGKVALGRIQSYMQVSRHHLAREQQQSYLARRPSPPPILSPTSVVPAQQAEQICQALSAARAPLAESLSWTMPSSKQRQSTGLYTTSQSCTRIAWCFVQELELEQVPLQPAAAPGAPAILIRNSSFAWEQDGAPLLRHLNLEVTSGQLLIVVGEVGAGGSLSAV